MAAEEIALTSFPLDATVEIKFDASDIADNITRQQALQLIKELDDEMGSWPLTLLLAEYFSDQVELARKEGYSIVALSSEELLAKVVEADEKEAADGR